MLHAFYPTFGAAAATAAFENWKELVTTDRSVVSALKLSPESAAELFLADRNRELNLLFGRYEAALYMASTIREAIHSRSPKAAVLKARLAIACGEVSPYLRAEGTYADDTIRAAALLGDVKDAVLAARRAKLTLSRIYGRLGQSYLQEQLLDASYPETEVGPDYLHWLSRRLSLLQKLNRNSEVVAEVQRTDLHAAHWTLSEVAAGNLLGIAGRSELALGNATRAIALFRRSLAMAVSANHRRGVFVNSMLLAGVACSMTRFGEALSHLRVAEQYRGVERKGDPSISHLRMEIDIRGGYDLTAEE